MIAAGRIQGQQSPGLSGPLRLVKHKRMTAAQASFDGFFPCGRGSAIAGIFVVMIGDRQARHGLRRLDLMTSR